jgi:hypothetical protein
MLIVVLLLIFWKKGTIALTVILVLLAVAMWLEGFNYDADLVKLWETGSYEQSKVETIKDKEGNSIKLIGSCVKADVNCDNFETQIDAQTRYDSCMDEIKSNNNIEDTVKLDIYGLDRDHDGIACESLPKLAQ